MDYQHYIQRNRHKPNYIRNGFIAFVCGGMIGVIGQALIDLYRFWGADKDQAQSLMIVTLILITALLTGFGVWDYFGDFAGAGAFVPITGFSNAMTSAALEGKSEGITLGIAANMFKLTGSVIALGVSSAYIIGIIRYLIMRWFG
ncbi:MAG TPA: stage V sporulation protein AC [Haloplasmataceae bacterium]